jgi:hypothetical protein
LLWSDRDAVGNSTSQQLIPWRIRFGIHALYSEVAVAGIAHQQALAFQITGDALSDGVR